MLVCYRFYFRRNTGTNYIIGAPTYLVSPVDFAQNPMSLFVALARYKIKDTYATGQMLEYAMTSMAGKGFQLQELKNLMIATDGRPKVDMCKFILFCMIVTLADLPQTRKFDYTLRLLLLTERQSTLSIPTSSIQWLLLDLTCASNPLSYGLTCVPFVEA
jgi:hypothetical protein